MPKKFVWEGEQNDEPKSSVDKDGSKVDGKGKKPILTDSGEAKMNKNVEDLENEIENLDNELADLDKFLEDLNI